MDHPFYEVAQSAEEQMMKGAIIYQKYTCGRCGIRKTMEEPNQFFKTGICEDCGFETDIVATGCNFMAVWERS